MNTQDDVTKRAARTITARLRADWTPLTLAQNLADAGLLRAPVEHDERDLVDLNEAARVLGLLVELRNGPRDEHYRASKDAAWDQAMAVLRALAYQHPDQP